MKKVLAGQFSVLVMAMILVGQGGEARGQNSSLFSQSSPNGDPPPATLPRGSWTYMAVQPPKKIERHDIVIVRVDEIARVSSDGEYSRRKISTYNAELKDWLIWPRFFSIKPAPQSDGDQRVQGQLQQQQRATGELETRESLALSIACEIVDMRPNGTLVLEGHKQVAVNEENWEVSLTGLCRREDIAPDNTVLSRNVLDLKLDKREQGLIHDGYKRGWFVRWFDEFDPF